MLLVYIYGKLNNLVYSSFFVIKFNAQDELGSKLVNTPKHCRKHSLLSGYMVHALCPKKHLRQHVM